MTDKEMVTSPNKTQKPVPKAKETNAEDKQKPKPKPSSNIAKEKIDASEFTKEELIDPDIADNLNSVKVLDFKIAKVQKEIDSIEGRAPPKLREKLLKYKVRKNVLEQQLGESMSIESYILLMKKQLDKDKRLVQYFEQNGMNEQGKKVAERMPIMIKEMEEAIDFAKSKK